MPSVLKNLPPNEYVMQQVWRHGLWKSGKAVTVEGQSVEIIDPGAINNGPGPDFANARIRIDGNIWAGSVEIHLRASDWHRHGHDGDPAYANVILHVVGLDDATVTMAGGRTLPQLIMRLDSDFIDTFNRLIAGPRLVLPVCGDKLPAIAPVFKTDWISALAFERLQRKASDVAQRLQSAAGDWYQTLFITLARGLGFGRNTDNMERLGRSIPYKRLLQHTDSPEAIEAMLFGQAGLLDIAAPADEYEATLVREYRFYATKYGLTPIDSPVWQLTSRNGANTPHRRIALLARIVCNRFFSLGINVFDNLDVETASRIFDVEPGRYWSSHTVFGRRSDRVLTGLGRQSADLLTINVLVPMVYHRGEQTGRFELMDKAIDILESIKPEQNAITRGFADFDVNAPDAFTSQALVQLHREYCERRRCLECRLGHRMLAQNISFKP